MFNPILFILSAPPDYIEKEISGMKKCFISGTIKDIQLNKNSECLKTIKVLILGENNGYYSINTIKLTSCSSDGPYIVYSDKTLPKVGDNVNYLINKDGYFIIGDESIGEGTYELILGNNLYGNTQICEPNSNFIEFHKEYLYYGIIICFLIIIGIFINLVIKNRNKT